MQRVVGFLITVYCKYTRESSSEKCCKSVKIGLHHGHEFVAQPVYVKVRPSQ